MKWKGRCILQNGTHMIESPLETKFEILEYKKKLVKSGPILFPVRLIKFNGPFILMFLKSRYPIMLFWSSLLQMQFKFTYWTKLIKYIFLHVLLHITLEIMSNFKKVFIHILYKYILNILLVINMVNLDGVNFFELKIHWI
jgi:hypothetical protein